MKTTKPEIAIMALGTIIGLAVGTFTNAIGLSMSVEDEIWKYIFCGAGTVIYAITFITLWYTIEYFKKVRGK
jgi:hypothetical protein